MWIVNEIQPCYTFKRQRVKKIYQEKILTIQMDSDHQNVLKNTPSPKIMSKMKKMKK